MTKPGRWQFWIDRGGTFTDIVARRPDGVLLTHKLLSENPARYDDAALAGIRHFLGVPAGAPIPSRRIEMVRMGTTVATNALLQRRGEPTVLFITRGFRDQLRIGYQNRPRLFDRHIVLPELLYSRVEEVSERVTAHGDVLVPLDEADVRQRLQTIFDAGLRAVAIVLMHAYRFSDHERRVAAIARDVGFTQVSASHEVSPLIKLVARGDTTVVDAFLSPILRRYVDRVAAELPGVRLMFMQSSGGLTGAEVFQGKDSVLSGPAGGIVGMAHTAQAAGFRRVIGFDMGGTSTDVSHFNADSGEGYERSFDTLVAGVRMRAPMMSIHTVAAGGGSILHFDGGKFRVGPDSAGADPGPACYRKGGPLTVTDCNVLLGRIAPNFFPQVFGPAGDQALDAEIIERLFVELTQQINAASQDRRTPQQVAEGFIDIAVANMANAIKKISVQRGYDVTKYVLNCFGGAAGQHACRVADALGMTRVLLHPLAGVLSAYGMGLADITAMREASIELPLAAHNLARCDAVLGRLGKAVRSRVAEQGVAAARITLSRRVHLRYEGTDAALILPYASLEEMRSAFEAAYRQRYSFLMPDKPLLIEAVSVEAVGSASVATPSEGRSEHAAATASAAYQPGGRLAVEGKASRRQTERVRMFCLGRWHDTPVFARDQLAPAAAIVGPAIVCDANSTTVIEPDWRGEVLGGGELLLSRAVPRPERHAMGTRADPVMLEIFNNLFMSIAEQMGAALANTAFSVNIKERMDFSCALFDCDGNLIANAPHIPVHLGSMGESVRSVIERNTGSLRPGNVYALNDPYHGGTHLPDVTVVTPVFDDTGEAVHFIVASRGHHADIGGVTPGSMPPESTTIEEEGVLLDNFLLVEGGRLREAEVRAALAGGRYPARNPEQNIADLRAQIAANEKGVSELRNMVHQFGIDVVRAYMGHVQDNAEEAVRRVIGLLRDGASEQPMDNGAVIRVAVSVDRRARRARIDFSGTSAQLANNFNAPRPVCIAAVLYVFRTLVNDDIPMNAGCLRPIEVVIPEGSMLSPSYPAATVAGNVETSQCITEPPPVTL